MKNDVAQLVKEATEAVKDVPDELKQIAFGKAFDALLAEQQGRNENPPASAKGQRRKTSSKVPDHRKAEAVGESNRSQLDQLDRTSHPEITYSGTALTNSLRLLRAARDELEIDGLSGSDIAHVLTDKFRCKITRQAVSTALNNAGQLVNRYKEGNSVIFRIMSRGEQYLDDLDAGVETDPKPTKQRKTSGKKGKTTKSSTAITKSSPKGASKRTTSKKSPGAMAAITQLYDAGFFSQPQSIATIIEHLKHTVGRTYKPNEMSPALLRYLRSNKLTRSKNADNQYEYKNG